MTTEHYRLSVTLTPEERASVDVLAKQLRLNRSELLRRLVLGHRLPNPDDFAAAQGIRDLLRINADQARLGNLLKLALDESDGKWPTAVVAQIGALAAAIEATQADLKAGVKALHHHIHPRAAR